MHDLVAKDSSFLSRRRGLRFYSDISFDSAMTALLKTPVSAQDTLENIAHKLVVNVRKDVNFAAKELVTKFLDRVCGEAIENEFCHETVAAR